jgi:hypothetical protein
MRSHRALAFAVLFALPAAAQSYQELVTQLAAATSLDAEMVGDDGGKSENFVAYERLFAIATETQWRELTKHPAAVVRGYAARALRAMKAKVDWQQLVLDHLADEAKVMVCDGCCRAEERIGDAIFRSVQDQLTPAQELAIGTAALQQKSPLYLREWALRNVTFDELMLHPLRAMAKDGEPAAAIALARYHIASDVPILIAHLQRDTTGKAFDGNCQFLAATVNKDPRLLPVLTGLVDAARDRLAYDNAYRLRFWIEALIVQDAPAAADCLHDFLTDARLTAYKRADLAVAVDDALTAAHAGATFAAVHELAARLRAGK